MDPALPVLVTRLPDRGALARLLRSALRHEIAHVALTEAPRHGVHTLELSVGGSPPIAVLAELAGAPQRGQFPLRLRPLHPGQAAELFALVEAERPPSEGSIRLTGAPHDDAAPILRAMSGSAPPPVTDIALAGAAATRLLGSQARLPTLPAHLTHDAHGGARGGAWAPPLAPATAATSEDGASADDPSLSVSVVFEPDMFAATVGAAAATALAAPSEDGAPGGADEPLPADSDGPSLSVSIDFEPRASAGASAGADAASFFDEDFANLAMGVPADGDDGGHVRGSSEPPPSVAELVAVPPPPDEDDDDDDDDDGPTLVRLPGGPNAGLTPMPAGVAAAQSEAPVAPSPAAAPLAAAREDFTPTHETPLAQKRSPTGGGRKRKTTRSGKATGAKKKTTRHPEGREARGSEAPARGSPVGPDDNDGSDPLLGRRVADGKYLIEAAIGSGAAGAVYKATHRELRRTVAIKVLHPHYQQDPHFMKSFRGEALAASQLDHPNVMRVLDFGQEPDGLVYIVMEFLSGRTLQSLLDEERRLQTDRAAEIMIQVCAALSVAHDKGIIHRDIKPDNIMLVPSRNDEGATFELVKVCDFGIAALQNPSREDADIGLADNVIAGTPEYMSPEQASGSEIDARSDVYACGICLYELVTGRPPFLGENPAEILVKQVEELPRAPSQLLNGLDSLVEEIILRAIQKEPQQRQQSARELRVELKEIVDPGDGGGANDDNERSIVENVPVLDDPASGFPGFFIALSSAVLRFGRFERGHPEAVQAMKELTRATKAALRGRSELTFARRDSAKQVGFCVMTGYGEIVDLRRLLGSQLNGSFGEPFIEALMKQGVVALTLREGLPDTELHYLIEMLLGPHAHDELCKELLTKPLRHVSTLFGSDVLGRDRSLAWKVGLCAARLARDLRALSAIRGISLKKMREIRGDLITGVAHLLTRGDEVRQFLFNADLVDEAVQNLRGFSGFSVAPLVFERLLHEPCAEAVTLLLADFDSRELDATVIHAYLRAFATRLLGERSPKSDAAVVELYRRSIVTDEDLPRDLREQIRAQSLADALVREPMHFLRMLDALQDPTDYTRELATLEAAMAVLARRAEAPALLAAIALLARHAKGTGRPGPRESQALLAMKSMIDKHRLLPIAQAVLTGPLHQRESARQILVLAGRAGAQALYAVREALTDASARPQWVQMFKETGPAAWSLLSAVLPRIEVNNDTDIAFVEDLLRAMPERQDAALGDAVARFLAHPRLRSAALAAIVPLWGERARKPLMDALEFAEEPARILAVAALRQIRCIDEEAVNVLERLLTMKGSASEELRVAAAAALADAGPGMRPRAIALLSKGVEGKRGIVAMLRGDGGTEESTAVTEAMARALLSLDIAEGTRAIKARISKSDHALRVCLSALVRH